MWDLKSLATAKKLWNIEFKQIRWLLTHLLCLFHRHAAQRSAIALFRWLQLGLGSPPPRVRAASSIVSFLRELKTTYLFLQSFSLV